jgi:hypothetical protein
LIAAPLSSTTPIKIANLLPRAQSRCRL